MKYFILTPTTFIFTKVVEVVQETYEQTDEYNPDCPCLPVAHDVCYCIHHVLSNQQLLLVGTTTARLLDGTGRKNGLLKHVRLYLCRETATAHLSVCAVSCAGVACWGRAAHRLRCLLRPRVFKFSGMSVLYLHSYISVTGTTAKIKDFLFCL
jgi:hypothetical protein